MSVISGLDPQVVWKQFAKICSIPHPSHHEEAIAQYVISEAERHGQEWRRDEIGNVLVTKPAQPGFESAPALTLQGHLDMVPVAAPSAMPVASNVMALAVVLRMRFCPLRPAGVAPPNWAMVPTR